MVNNLLFMMKNRNCNNTIVIILEKKNKGLGHFEIVFFLLSLFKL